MLGLVELCAWDGEENELLTKTQICDTPGSDAVAGVFIRYDHMDPMLDPDWVRPRIPDPDWKRPMINDPSFDHPLIPDPRWTAPLIPDPDWVWPLIPHPEDDSIMVPDMTARPGVVLDPNAKVPLIPDPRVGVPQVPDMDAKPNMIPDMSVEHPLIDDPEYVPGDFYVAQTGDFIIRVTGPVRNGQLLESNGDGTARAQKDNVQRASTIAKAAFSFPDAAPDEENIVPCLLMLG